MIVYILKRDEYGTGNYNLNIAVYKNKNKAEFDINNHYRPKEDFIIEEYEVIE